MKAILLILALAVVPAVAQEKTKAPPKAKPAAVAKAHSKPSPEQIRKFNALEKKQGK